MSQHPLPVRVTTAAAGAVGRLARTVADRHLPAIRPLVAALAVIQRLGTFASGMLALATVLHFLLVRL